MSGSIFHPFVLDNAAGQDTVVGIGSDSEKYGVGISSHVHITGIGTFSDLLHTTGVIHAAGGIKDTSGNIGSSGKVLSSTGSGLQWIDPSEGSTANAVNVGTNLNSTNSDQFVAFMGASSGNNPVRVDAGIKYNPSSNLLTVGSITGSIAASNINSGTLGLDRIPSLPASKITSGQFDAARIPTLNQNTTGNAATATSATTAGTVTTAAQTNITSLGTLTGLTVNGNIIQSGMSNYIRVNGAIQDKDGQSGNSGQVLSSTGSQIDWVNVGSLAAGSAAEIAVSDESTETSCNVLFSTSASGNIAPKTGSNLTFNSSSGLLVASGFSGDGSSISSINGSNISTGTVAAARIDNLNASKINAGTLGVDRIPNLAASKINSGTLGVDRIPNLAASKITSGALGTDRIPNLNASKITAGTLGTARIPNLAASKITSGTLGTDRIPSLPASKITSGQFDAARIPTLNQNTSGNSATATTLQNPRTIGGVSFNGSGNIDLPGVNITGNQNTTGNAGSATILANTRTIGGVSFNGSANINLPGVNIAGNQNTSGIADKAETARIVTDNTSAIRPILFIASSGSDNSAVNNTFASLKFSPTIFSLSYNPNTEIFYVNKAQLNKIQVSSGSAGNAGQVLTSGGSGSNMTWTYPVPSGGIIIWSGAANAIPSGWVLCDGNNGTPDLRNRFIVGAGAGGNYSPNDTGGAESVTLTTAQMPSHNHGVNDSGHTHNLLYNHGAFGGTSGAVTPRSGNTPVTPGITGRISTQTTGISIQNAGSGQSHENRPPYYALCYIMKS